MQQQMKIRLTLINSRFVLSEQCPTNNLSPDDRQINSNNSHLVYHHKHLVMPPALPPVYPNYLSWRWTVFSGSIVTEYKSCELDKLRNPRWARLHSQLSTNSDWASRQVVRHVWAHINTTSTLTWFFFGFGSQGSYFCNKKLSAESPTYSWNMSQIIWCAPWVVKIL